MPRKIPAMVKINRKDKETPPACKNKNSQEQEVKMTLIEYSDEFYSKKQVTDLGSICSIIGKPGIKWLNVDGINDVDVVESIGLQFGVHFLVLEDIMDTDQRPKVEDDGKYLYTVLKMVYFDPKNRKIISEQLSIILFSDIVITFQEEEGYDVFDPIRNRIMNNKGRIRKGGADFLAYSLIDAIVDNYVSVIDEIGGEISTLEREVLTNPNPEVLEKIYNLKMDIVFYRNAIWPAREVVIQLQKTESDLLRDNILPYYRDVNDHVLQALDTVKVYNDTVTGILDIYNSSVNNQTTEVMRRLTFITTIFMPLSVLAGIGGMSEWTMMTGGEKNWPYAYAGFVLMLTIIGFITYQVLKKTYNSRK